MWQLLLRLLGDVDSLFRSIICLHSPVVFSLVLFSTHPDYFLHGVAHFLTMCERAHSRHLAWISFPGIVRSPCVKGFSSGFVYLTASRVPFQMFSLMRQRVIVSVKPFIYESLMDWTEALMS